MATTRRSTSPAARTPCTSTSPAASTTRVLRQPWAIFDFSGQLLVKGSKDAVGHANPPPDTYRLTVIPPGAEEQTRDADAEEWRRWWWLRFEGRWGQRDGILSPFVAEDHLRWARPVDWARDHCAAESVSWSEATGSPDLGGEVTGR
jgi:hypothetical protein